MPRGETESLAGEIPTRMAANVIEWRLTPVPFTTAVDTMPTASSLARVQASQGYKVTNLRGELVTLDEIHRQTLTQLDASRDLDKLTDALLDPLRRRKMILRRDGDASIVLDEAEMRTLLGPALCKVLQNSARQALFAVHSA